MDFCFVDFDGVLFRFSAALQHLRKRFRPVNIRLIEVTACVPLERTVYTLFFQLRLAGSSKRENPIESIAYSGISSEFVHIIVDNRCGY